MDGILVKKGVFYIVSLCSVGQEFSFEVKDVQGLSIRVSLMRESEVRFEVMSDLF